jgi:hypothetical protein
MFIYLSYSLDDKDKNSLCVVGLPSHWTGTSESPSFSVGSEDTGIWRRREYTRRQEELASSLRIPVF